MNIFILHYYDDENSFNHRLFLREKDFYESIGCEVSTTALTHNNYNPVSGRENFRVAPSLRQRLPTSASADGANASVQRFDTATVPAESLDTVTVPSHSLFPFVAVISMLP